ncbi:MAG: metallophosphoesterase family protein [Oscillospiraceae bacterium]
MNIALISDIHFGKFSRTAEFSVPGEAIDDDETCGASDFKTGLIDVLKKKKVEYIFVAGDLTSIGSPQEFYYCEKKILEIASEIGLPQDRIILSMGNHDIDRKVYEIYKQYDHTKLPNYVVDLMKGKYQGAAANISVISLEQLGMESKCASIPFTGVIQNERFIVFILNSSWLCSSDQEYPHGKLDSKQLNWLKNQLIEFEMDTRIKIILMHHHPILYSYPTPSPDVSMIEEGSELMNLAGRYGINLILHGHRHHPTVKTMQERGWKNPITIICAGSLSVNARHRNYGEIPNTLHIIDLDKGPDEFVLYNYEYSTAQGWHPLSNDSPSTPMDGEMWLGKIFSPDEVKETLLNLFKDGKFPIKWDELPNELKHIQCKALNECINDLFSNEYNICGTFPKERVAILPR